ncbi:coiled-coil domain-containing protein 141 isoform X1 [Pleurodeles waltl]|uniref:coiled-coil domain-containing protein 141 isoform X1 n=1 Tax=Pleurodeles waltl TaxID=8319 RepID=UPI0037095EA4
MSGEDEPGGQAPTTTAVSSVAVQAGDCRLVVAVLKSGKLVQLQLAESVPNLLEIGSSQDETKKLLQDHELLLVKLKSLEDNVWDLLCEADKVADDNVEQSQVYEAMAETLGEAWTALVHMLEKRKELLSFASEFFDNALEFAVTIDQADDFLHNAQDFEHADSLKELLQQNHLHMKVLLERSLALLNKSRELTEFIEEFKSGWPVLTSEITQGARSSCAKIDSLLELLQDRRRQLDKHLKQQRQELQQVLQICHWHQEEERVTCWFKKDIEDYLQNGLLGYSLTENEELLREYKEHVLKATEWSSALENLKKEARKILLSEDYTDKDNLKCSNENLSTLQTRFWQLMDERANFLQETNDFFKSANKAFDKLGGIEAYLKLLNAEGLSLPVLASKHEELQKEIKDCATGAVQRGEALVTKGSASFQVTGIQEMIGYIQKRVDQLTNQCPAHREQSLKKQQRIESLEEHLKTVSMSVEKISSELAHNVEDPKDAGSTLKETEKLLHKYMELARQAMESSHELEAAVRVIEELEHEPAELAEFARKANLLHKELGLCNQRIAANLEALNVYVGFLKSAKELDEQIQNLKQLYSSEPVEEDNDTAVKMMLETADLQWQTVLKNIITLQDKGHDCLNYVTVQVNNKPVLMEAQVLVIKQTTEKVQKEKVELTNLWTSWQRHINQMKSVKNQWRKLKDHLKQTTQSLKNLEEVLLPEPADRIGNNTQSLSDLQDRCNKMKPQFQQLNAEVEYAVKLSELLSLKGALERERCKKIAELVQLHQRVKDKIKEYEDLLIKMSTFHQVREELENLVKTNGLENCEPPEVPKESHQAQIHLSHTRERHTHIKHLYKLALRLGTDISSTVQHSKTFSVPLKDLQQQVDVLEYDCNKWTSQAATYEEELSSNLSFCTVRDEINELKESFKDLKKKFNNLKFNYMKKTEKARNSKVLKNHIQQVEMFAEKIQSLTKKMDNIEKKVCTSTQKEPSDKDVSVQQTVTDLQTQFHEFVRGVEEYKKHLDMTENLQQLTEECNFWCEEASATVVRVGKYSAECKTKEAVQVLFRQFKKFVHPTTEQQEERIQRITDLAANVYGAEEGAKYVEKTVLKHKEALDSVNELCSYLKELEDKLERDRSCTPQCGYFNQEMSNVENGKHHHSLDNACEGATMEEVGDQRQMDLKNLQGVSYSLKEDIDQCIASCLKEGSVITEGGDLPIELLAEETPSGDEYECISPDDMSLPPLSETPESNLLHSETEQEEQPCCSSQSLHVSSYSMQIQINSGSKQMVEQSELVTPVAFADTTDNKREKTSSYFESFYSPPLGFHPKFRIESPCVPHPPAASASTTASHAIPGTLKANSAYSMKSEVHETHLQHHTIQKSMRETQNPLHASNPCTNSTDRQPTSPDVFSGLVFQSDLQRSSPRLTVPQEETRRASEKTSMTSLSGQSPTFSKLLSNATVKEGSPVTLEVEVTGFPEPTLTWWVAYNEGQQIN